MGDSGFIAGIEFSVVSTPGYCGLTKTVHLRARCPFTGKHCEESTITSIYAKSQYDMDNYVIRLAHDFKEKLHRGDYSGRPKGFPAYQDHFGAFLANKYLECEPPEEEKIDMHETVKYFYKKSLKRK